MFYNILIIKIGKLNGKGKIETPEYEYITFNN